MQQWLRQGQPNCFLPLDRSFVDPFAERWPVTLRCEGTVRGVGGIRLTGDDCSTGVPGLYAAGDAASRERLTGAISGGGGPNSSWAIASGNWAGRAAAEYARRAGRRHDDADRPLSRSGAPACGRAADVRDDVARAPRSDAGRAGGDAAARPQLSSAARLCLEASLARLDASWTMFSDHAARRAAPRRCEAREAAALTATSRWAYRSALARAESRGMHRRRDHPATDPAFDCLFEASGLESVAVARRAIARGPAAA